MQKYLLNILPRLKAYGKQLDKMEEFADKTWVLADSDGKVITYRFKRNGVLRKSINGDIQDLHWELEGTDAIAIIDPLSKRGEMFRHGFILEGLLFVQKEGLSTTPIVFFNEAVVKDGSVNSYLLDTILQNGWLKKHKDSRGYFYDESDGPAFFTVGASVFDNELQPVMNDKIKLVDKIIHITNGRIKFIDYFVTYQSDKGKVKITSVSYRILDGTISIGDEIKVGEDYSFTGKVTLSNKTKLTIENGKVVSVNEVLSYLPILLSMIVTGVLIFVLVYFNK
jgi:hypothetical protein